MNILVSVYQRRHNHRIHWITVGVGDLTVTTSGRNEGKLREKVSNILRQKVMTLAPSELWRVDGTPLLELQRHRLEFAIKGDDGRRKVSQTFPLIVETRLRTKDESIRIAYHPNRQDEWFTINPNESTAYCAGRAFARFWKKLTEDEIAELHCVGRESLKSFGFNAKTRNLISEIENKDDPFKDLEFDPARYRDSKNKGKQKTKKAPLLHRLGTDLTQLTADGSLSLGRPRQPYRSQMTDLIGPSRKVGVVLVGKSGVGKTTIIHRFVDDLLRSQDYDIHTNLDLTHHVWTIAAKRLIAGMSYLGEWEKRVLELLDHARHERVLLYAEDLADFSRVGRSRDSDRSFADLFMGPVSDGEIALIGECSPSQWQKLQDDAPSFANAFHVVRVLPADVEECGRMLVHQMRESEKEHSSVFYPGALTASLEASQALFGAESLPGKATDLVKKLGKDGDPDGIDAYDVYCELESSTGLVDSMLDPSDTELNTDEAQAFFARRVIGQQAAVDAASDLIFRVRMGLTDPSRPYATYLFTGPTGTGKTEMAKAICDFMYDDERGHLLRFDMGELSGPDAASRLVGDRYRPEGALTEAISQQPFSIVLLDEIEKAHPLVLHLLLQLLDEGRLTDAAGLTHSFANAVVIMTSNLGAKPRASVGFGQTASGLRRDVDKAVKQFFPPELFNRIDRVVPFDPLEPATAEKVAHTQLQQLVSRRGLSRRDVFVVLDPEAASRVASEAFSARDGARGVRRYLERNIALPLSEEIARQSKSALRIVSLSDEEGSYRLRSEAVQEQPALEVDFRLSPFMRASAAVLAQEVPTLIDFVNDIIEGGALDRLSASIEAGLREHRNAESGQKESRDAAETVYTMDGMRQELIQFRSHLERFEKCEDRAAEDEIELRLAGRISHPRDDKDYEATRIDSAKILDRRWMLQEQPVLERQHLLLAIAEASFLTHSLNHAHRPEQHSVALSLTNIGRDNPTWLDTLWRAYDSGRGETTELRCFDANGEYDPRQEKQNKHRKAQKVWIKKEGLCIREYYREETGYHVLNAAAGGSQLVEVSEVSIDGRFDPLDEGVGPIALRRKIVFEGQAHRKSRKPFPYTLEDYSTAFVESGRTQSLEDAIHRMLMLRASRVSETSQ